MRSICFDSEPGAASCGDVAPLQARAGIGPEPCTLMTLTRLAVGLEPSNAPDAAHRSPRSISPKRNEGWVPRWTRTRESIKQNKELTEYSGVSLHRQEISRDASLSAFREINRRLSILDRAEGEHRCLASRFFRRCYLPKHGTVTRFASITLAIVLGDLSASAVADRRLISEIRTNNTK